MNGNKCGNQSFDYIKKKMHIGCYCKKCGSFIKWVPKTPENIEKAIENPKAKPLY